MFRKLKNLMSKNSEKRQKRLRSHVFRNFNLLKKGYSQLKINKAEA